MALFVVLESFCLWNVCIKNNKISETLCFLFSVPFYFLSGFKVFEFEIGEKKQ